ncbi:MAG: YHYH protein [Acidimicrobiia bacterium]|nr:YHYH protein [Acidimicrobiia bacterium]
MKRANTRVIVAVIVALALVAAACSDSAEEAATTTTSTATTTTTATGGDASSGSTDPGSETQSLASDYLGSYELMNEAYGTMVTVTVDGSTRTIETNALPDHNTGEFPNAGNPNTITAQDLTWELPAEPAFTGSATNARTPGVAVNGVKFEPATAETVDCSTGESYRVEALQDLYDLGLDFNNAHVQPTGEYHYHGVSELLVEAYESDEDLVHIGFASDGYLMYYSKSGAYESSYALSTEARAGTDCELSLPGGEPFDVDGTAPDGAYTSDWVFDEANGDLDSCNGTTIDGQYVYFLTDAYPFISRCLNGEFTESRPGP